MVLPTAIARVLGDALEAFESFAFMLKSTELLENEKGASSVVITVVITRHLLTFI